MKGTPIAWPLRVWFVAELFFAVSATLSVALDPAQTGSNFAWTIKPAVMGALFGAFYVALMPVLLLALFARRWEMVRVFVIPALLFTFAELVVTFVHWDRFAVGTGPFNIWFASYLLPPPVFLGCWLWQQRQARALAEPPADSAPLARWQRLTLWLLGAVFTLEALIGIFWPTWFSASAPWPVSALNGRALAGYLGLLGLLMLSMAHENERDRVRIVAPFLVGLLPVAAVQVSRFADQVNWAHPRIAIMAVLLCVVAALGSSLVRGSWRRTLS